MSNKYFSNRITINQIKNDLGINSSLDPDITKLQGDGIQRLSNSAIKKVSKREFSTFKDDYDGSLKGFDTFNKRANRSSTNTIRYYKPWDSTDFTEESYSCFNGPDKPSKGQIVVLEDAYTKDKITGEIRITNSDISYSGITFPPVGTLGYFAYDTETPDGWLECAGQAILYEKKKGSGYVKTEFYELYQTLDSWGIFSRYDSIIPAAGDGKVFVVPDLSGYFVRCMNINDFGLQNNSTYKNIPLQKENKMDVIDHEHIGDNPYSRPEKFTKVWFRRPKHDSRYSNNHLLGDYGQWETPNYPIGWQPVESTGYTNIHVGQGGGKFSGYQETNEDANGWQTEIERTELYTKIDWRFLRGAPAGIQMEGYASYHEGWASRYRVNYYIDDVEARRGPYDGNDNHGNYGSVHGAFSDIDYDYCIWHTNMTNTNMTSVGLTNATADAGDYGSYYQDDASYYYENAVDFYHGPDDSGGRSLSGTGSNYGQYGAWHQRTYNYEGYYHHYGWTGSHQMTWDDPAGTNGYTYHGWSSRLYIPHIWELGSNQGSTHRTWCIFGAGDTNSQHSGEFLTERIWRQQDRYFTQKTTYPDLDWEYLNQWPGFGDPNVNPNLPSQNEQKWILWQNSWYRNPWIRSWDRHMHQNIATYYRSNTFPNPDLYHHADALSYNYSMKGNLGDQFDDFNNELTYTNRQSYGQDNYHNSAHNMSDSTGTIPGLTVRGNQNAGAGNVYNPGCIPHENCNIDKLNLRNAIHHTELKKDRYDETQIPYPKSNLREGGCTFDIKSTEYYPGYYSGGSNWTSHHYRGFSGTGYYDFGGMSGMLRRRYMAYSHVNVPHDNIYWSSFCFITKPASTPGSIEEALLNSGDNGALTSEDGDHDHGLHGGINGVFYQGQEETRPHNIALRMFIKY